MSRSTRPTARSLSRRGATTLALGASLALVLAACADTSDVDPNAGGDGTDGTDGGGSSASITVGTTDRITSLDPAGSYDNGSYMVQIQIYPFLLAPPQGSSDVEPDIAETAEFTAPTEYTVTLKEGLTFANGNELTSSDVKFTFDRQLAIADENGPSSLLYNLESVEATDDQTVVFHLLSENDQTFPQVLSSPVGPIVDEDVFSADALTDAQTIVDGNAFAGPYTITDYTENELIRYVANDASQGIEGAPATGEITAQYFTDQTTMKLAVENGDIDVAFRSLSPTDVEDLEGNESVAVHHGPGGEIRYMVFNFDTMPFGAQTAEADPAKALAVRQAIADVIDREALSTEVYKGTYSPLYSYVPDGLTGANTALQEAYGDGSGGPDLESATQRLADAGVTTPVALNIQYSPDHYGESSDDEYAMIANQLNESGLFDVTLASTLWTTYTNEYRNDGYPMFQLGWFPDYSDADNYLSPFFLPTNFINNHFEDAAVTDLITRQATTADEAERTALIEETQTAVAQHLPTLPFLQGDQIAVAGTDITGVEETLDASFRFRYGSLGRN